MVSFDIMTRIFYMLNAGMVLTLESHAGARIRAAIQLHFNALTEHPLISLTKIKQTLCK